MPGIARLGDICTGHGGWPPRPIVSASPKVRVDGIPVARVGDSLASHTNPAIPETHAGTISSGNSKVRADGIPIARIGDSVSCGGAVASGSGKSFA
jgi:uncharacterized Zn-binding protein involved in type VI secretion